MLKVLLLRILLGHWGLLARKVLGNGRVAVHRSGHLENVRNSVLYCCGRALWVFVRNPHAAPPFSLGRKKAALMNTWVGVDWERGCVMGRVVEANTERLKFPLLIINGEGGGGGVPNVHCASRSF
jgi:hypothetical protein